MGLFIALIVLLVLAIVFFVTFPILRRKIIAQKYSLFCSKKIRAIAKKNNYLFLTNLNLTNYSGDEIKIDHILFGKKYIYILINYFFNGDIKGTSENNSWILEKRRNEGCEYIDNISNDLSGKNRVFSEKITANPELIIPIAIVNNDCEIKVNGINDNNTFVVHYSSLKKLIKNLESRSIANLDEEQIKNTYEILKNGN